MDVSAQVVLLQAFLELSSTCKGGDGPQILMVGDICALDHGGYGSVSSSGVMVITLDSSENRVLEMGGDIQYIYVLHGISRQGIPAYIYSIAQDKSMFPRRAWLASRKKEWNNNRFFLKQPMRRTPTQRGK